jgi:hypothetical protein
VWPFLLFFMSVLSRSACKLFEDGSLYIVRCANENEKEDKKMQLLQSVLSFGMYFYVVERVTGG